MEEKDWNIFKCPSCKGLLKVAKNSNAENLRCPKCKTVVKLPSAAPPSTVAPTKSAASVTAPPKKSPAAPSAQPTPGEPAGTSPIDAGKENWEPLKHTKSKALDLDLKLSTQDEDVQVSEDAPTLERRRVYRGDENEDLSWEESGNRPTTLPKIMIIFVSVLLAVTVLLGWNLVRKDSGAERQRYGDLQVMGGKRQRLENSLNPAVYYLDIKAAISRFLGAPDLEELTKYVRDPDRVIPLMRDYYSRESTYQVENYAKLPEKEDLQAHQRYMVSVVDMADGKKRVIALEQNDNDEFKVDWESWVGYSEISWDYFVEKRETGPCLFRVMMGPDDYYNYGFTFDKWSCYQVQNPDGDKMLYAYIKRGGALEQRISKAILKNPFVFAVIRMRFPDQSPGGNQVLITEFVEEGWVLRDDNDDVDIP